MNQKLIVSDIETFAKYFCVVNYDIKRNVYVNFEICDEVNDLEKMKRYYKSFNKKDYMVTFNGINFDWPVIDWIIRQPAVNAKLIYRYAQKIINADIKDKWKYRPKWNTMGQIDLYQIHNYENPNKRTSLKWLQFSTRWHKMQDLPYHHSRELTRAQEKEVLLYCMNDVQSSFHFMKLSKSQIDLRFKLSKKYKKNFINHSEPKLAAQILLDKYCDKTGKNPDEIKKLRTFRKEVKIKDLIFDYINFKTESFNNVLNKFKNTIITENNKAKKIKENFKNIEYTFGLGGIHSSASGVFEKDDDSFILDADVTSYYPQVAIQNNFYPKHLGEEFCEAYSELFDERKLYNKKTHFEENYVIKIALNAAYGLSNAKHSFIYDPLYTFKTTITGQLSILMLIERILLLSDDIVCIQSNTDGASFKIPNKYKDKVKFICEKWEIHTKLNLEYADYTKMFVRDVNNYIAVYDYGDVKLKGCFEINPDYHKNSSFRVVAIAAANYVVNGIPYADTIKNHLSNGDYKIGNETIKNYGIYDFCIGKKASKSVYILKEEGKNAKTLHDKVLRYYISKTRKKIIKKYGEDTKRSGGMEAVNKGWFVEMFMDYQEKKDYNIEPLFYIEECRKIIDPVLKGTNEIQYNQLSLL